MRKAPAGLRKATSSKEKIPVKWSEGLDLFCERTLKRFQVKALILVGSVAKGTWTQASDIDVLVIAEDLPASFFDRLRQLKKARSCL